MPLRRFLNVNAEAVVGVCGGDEGPAWAKLQLGVVGRMATMLVVYLANSGVLRHGDDVNA